MTKMSKKVDRVWMRDGRGFIVYYDEKRTIMPVSRWRRWVRVWLRDGEVVAAARNGRILDMERRGAVTDWPSDSDLTVTWRNRTGVYLTTGRGWVLDRYGEADAAITEPGAGHVPMRELLVAYPTDGLVTDAAPPPEGTEHDRQREAAKRGDETNRKRREAHRAKLATREAEHAAAARQRRAEREIELKRRRDEARAAADRRRQAAEEAREAEAMKWHDMRVAVETLRMRRKAAGIDVHREVEVACGGSLTLHPSAVGPWKPTEWVGVGSIVGKWVTVDRDTGAIRIEAPPHACSKRLVINGWDSNGPVTKSVEVAIRVAGPTKEELLEREERDRAQRRALEYAEFAAETRRMNDAAAKRSQDAIAPRAAELERLKDGG